MRFPGVRADGEMEPPSEGTYLRVGEGNVVTAKKVPGDGGAVKRDDSRGSERRAYEGKFSNSCDSRYFIIRPRRKNSRSKRTVDIAIVARGIRFTLQNVALEV